ncbi:stage V sporulation protein T [Desulfuribacillus alkaliarsenatis]|uniref:Stage V sporulation protein T n=1 Tax=Desulfuribacillus alkaliarsenatis TaxID=766136 RepID=A0A1E5FYW1_9FIRM|nr:stage V sporulation protein T [Desulfuribacillus alkaliarsenatis]OEF95759.1 stage V sporulation protein T [Desulfuribacillus alkaliarsenatis]
MKATGIVRRIDDLGRVVIPKEIRRTLRIREGDPLEIFVDRDGGVILKKYSPIGELGDFAKEYVEALFESTGHIAVISDRDHVIAVAGAAKKDFIDKEVGEIIENAMDQRKVVKETTANEAELLKNVQESYTSYAVAPIISGGDPIGAIALASQKDGKKVGDLEVKLVETGAAFLAKQMEN